jgi:hypothetical protein
MDPDSNAHARAAEVRAAPEAAEGAGTLEPGSASHARLAAVQAAYYVATGVWPIVHIRSFEAVTGPKVDRWLVKTFGALISAVGAALATGARERRSRALAVLGGGTALALAAAETVYVLERRISPVYLLDALVELGLSACWALELSPRAATRGAR